MINPKTTIETDDFYYCKRCNTTSLQEQMCPCPRGNCETKIVGKVTTTTKVKLFKIIKNI